MASYSEERNIRIMPFKVFNGLLICSALLAIKQIFEPIGLRQFDYEAWGTMTAQYRGLQKVGPPPNLRRKPKPLLHNGTTIIQISPGMDVFKNVCLQKGEKKETNKLVSFTKDGKPLKSSLWKYFQRASWSKWTAVTENKTLQDWAKLSTIDYIVAEETLLTLQIWNNPGHCLNDLVFSLALNVTSSPLRPYYPKFLLSHFRRFQNSPDQSWCYEMMHHANLIDNTPNGLVAFPEEEDIMCFERLLVPMLTLHRFPLNWTDSTTANSLNSDGYWRKDVTGRFHLQENPFVYPIEALQLLRANVWQSLGITTTSPWVSTLDHRGKDIEMLFYDRRGTSRRVLENSDEIARLLEHNYDNIQVKLLGSDWNNFTFTQQASLYHKQSHIIAVHGAHLANLFFCRPGTQVVELVSGKKHAGQTGWFTSFTRRMGLQHHVFGEGVGPFSPKNFTMNATEVVSFVASRFGLKPK